MISRNFRLVLKRNNTRTQTQKNHNQNNHKFMIKYFVAIPNEWKHARTSNTNNSTRRLLLCRVLFSLHFFYDRKSKDGVGVNSLKNCWLYFASLMHKLIGDTAIRARAHMIYFFFDSCNIFCIIFWNCTHKTTQCILCWMV